MSLTRLLEIGLMLLTLSACAQGVNVMNQTNHALECAQAKEIGVDADDSCFQLGSK